ncbi:MAG: transporter [Rhodothermales bacterium]
MHIAALRFFVAAFVSLALSPDNLSAQCCSPGNPLGGRANIGVLPEREWKVTASYAYGYSGDYYEGDRSVLSDFVESGYFSNVSLNVSYGVSSRLTIESDLSYVVSKVQDYVTGTLPSRIRGSGFGDASTLLHVNVYRDRRRRWEVTTGLGLKYPIGSYKQKQDGAFLPIDVQSSSGAVDFIHSLVLMRSVPERALHFQFVHRIEKKRGNPDGYRYGDLYAASLFTSYTPTLRWNAIIQIRSEIRERDARPSGSIPVTGSVKAFVTPQIAYTVGPSLVLTAFADLPVYQYYNGKQLATTFAFSLGAVKRFGAGGLRNDRPPLARLLQTSPAPD